MKPPEDEDCVIIDSSGDRCLVVGEGKDQKRFLVSSYAMRLASPVWKVMFTGPYKEATTEEIPFPEGKPDAFVILLRTAHLQFRDLPSSLNFHELLNLAVICDEYDTVSVVGPFLAKWITPLEPLAFQIGYEEWLFIAWSFGYPVIFERITWRLIFSASTNITGQCLNENMRVLDDSLMPPGIIESILRTRSQIISDILKVCYRYLGQLESSPSKYCRTKTPRAECSALALGSLIRGFKPLGLWPERPNSSDISMSASKLVDALHRISIYTYYEDMSEEIAAIAKKKTSNYGRSYSEATDLIDKLVQKASSNTHKSCNFKEKFDRDIKTITGNIPSAVLDSHLQHMKKQSEKWS